jgi:4-oxalocrotonate tautomerase
MPNVTVEGPVIDGLGAKRTLAKEITDAMAKAYGLPKQAFVVIIKENPPQNVCVAGELLCDIIAAAEQEKS